MLLADDVTMYGYLFILSLASGGHVIKNKWFV
jgi:hypothetical protein